MAWPGELPFAGTSTGSTAAPTYPNLFVSPPFVAQPLSSSLNLSAEDGGTASAFTMEDRMLLRLMYNQQQIIQVQLNTIFSWMQLTNNKLAHLERFVQELDGQAHKETAPQPTTVTTPPPLRDVNKPRHGATSKAQDSATRIATTTTATMYPAHTQGHTSPGGTPQTFEAAPSANANPPHPARGHDASVATNGAGTAHAAHSDGPRSCTPPAAELEAGSCNQSVLNHSVDSIAAPWDPRTRPTTDATGGHLSSLRSSRGSQLGRQDNPLLSSLQQQQQQQRQYGHDSSQMVGGSVRSGNAAVAKPAPHSTQQLGSTRSLRSTSQADSTAAPRSESRQQAERAVPPYRRVAAGTGTTTVMSSSSPTPPPIAAVITTDASPDIHRVTALLTRRTHHPAAEARRSRTGTGQAEQETDSAAQRTTSAQPRAATPPLPEAQGTGKNDEAGSGDAERGSAHAGAAIYDLAAHVSPMTTGGTVANAASQRTRVYSDAALPQRRRTSGVNELALRDYDSLSDGYGSYESKQYLRNNGLL